MNQREIGRLIAGSLAIYVVMAACSATESANRTTKAAGGTSAIAANGGTTSSVVEGGATGITSYSSGSSSIINTIVNPVKDAYASTSGSRLKAKFRTGSDGSKEYLEGLWWDSERSEDCTVSPYVMTDGTYRCLPSNYGLIITSTL